MVGEIANDCVFQIIQIKPTVTADFPKMQEVKEGGEFVLTAKIDGSPPPTAIWLLEGEEVKADGERIIITEEESEDGLGIVTTLRITKAKDEDNGKYTLLVKNTAGEAKAESMVDVMGKPKPPRVVKEIEPKQVIFLDGLKSGKMEVPVGNKNGFRFDRTSFQRPKNACKRRKIYSM